MTFLSSTVKDQIKLNYVFFPLPYHHEVWVPHKLLPYFEDLCRNDTQKCYYYEYTDFCFKNQDFILRATSQTEIEIINGWANKVADHFGLNNQTLLDIYQGKD